MRLPFLLLTPVCVFLGVSTVISNQININFYLLILVLSSSLLGHISVNTLNEYFDFKSGLDSKIKFSGGSGVLPENPESVRVVLAVAIASLMVIVTMGIFFVWKFGLGIVPIGVLGLVLIVTYTSLYHGVINMEK